MKKIFLFLMLATILTSCLKSFSPDDAKVVMNQYYESVKNKNYDEIMKFYNEKFFEVTPKDKWESLLKKTYPKLGDFEYTELENWQIKNMATTSGSGTYYMLQYNTKYSKFPAVEKFTLFKPKGEKTIKIISHNITSDAFFE